MHRFLLILLLLGGPLQAQEVTIRNGEHATFTRVTLRIDEGTRWQLRRVGDAYRLRLPGATDADLEGFFARIPRKRIADVSKQTGPDLTLTFDLACDCHADAFLWAPDGLAVDFKDGPDPNPKQLALSEDPILPLLTERDRTPLPRFEMRIDSPPEQGERGTDLDALEASLMAQIAAMAAPGGLPKDADAVPDAPGISLRTDRSLFGARQTVDEAPPVECGPQAHFDVATWGGDDESFAAQLARARQGIPLEFDRADESKVLALARLYIYFGFGREAIAALSIDGQLSAERSAILTLGQIIDGDTIADQAFAARAVCGGPTALWAALAEGEAREGPDTDAIALEFKRLPPHLQRHLGPRLSNRLNLAKDLDAAETVLAPAQAIRGADAESLVRAEAELDIAFDRAPDARARLADLAATQADIAPETLIELIGLQIGEGMKVTPNQIKEIREQQFTHARSAILPALQETEVRALTHNGDFLEAAAALRRSEESFDADARRDLTDLVLLAATDRGSDDAFLDLAFSAFPARASDGVANAVADRLIRSGFGERAGDLLLADGLREDMAERRYLRAEAAVALGDVLLAERHLAGITTPRAERIRARARYGQDLPDDAVAEANLSDWRAGNWADLATSDDALLQSASAALLNEAGAIDLTAAPLADSERLLSDAAATRDTLDALLNRFPVDDPIE